MQQFSLYHTAEGLLYKTTCLLIEKSYHSNLRIVVLVPDIEVQESLNKMIWTYSRKQFIPHGSKLDPLPEKQPVYITHQLENPNQSTILMVIAPFDIYSNDLKNWNVKQGASKQSVQNTREHVNASQFCDTNSSKHLSIQGILTNKHYIAHFQRIIIIYDVLDNLSLIIKTINELNIATPVIDCYKQNPIGTWSKI